MGNDKSLSGVLIGVLYLVLGAVFIAATDKLLTTFNYILVCLCAVIGVLQIIGFFVNKRYKDGDHSSLLVGVVFIWVGLILYVYYRVMINILPILFSLYLFIMAVELIIKYVNLKNNVDVKGWKYLIAAILAIVIGLLLIFNPGGVIYTYLKVTGVYLILVSGLYLISYVKLFRK